MTPRSDWRERVLVIAPHADDETLGCGGMLASLPIESKKRVLVLTLGKTPTSPGEQTAEELRGAMETLGVTDFSVQRRGDQGRLDAYSLADLVPCLDAALADFRPTAVFLPYASHHQDHEVVYRAALAALRPRPLTIGIRLVALYEYPYVASWPPPELPGGKFHYALSPEALATKERALACYASQFNRAGGGWLTVERARHWSEMRGQEVGVEAAEAFWAVRGWL